MIVGVDKRLEGSLIDLLSRSLHALDQEAGLSTFGEKLDRRTAVKERLRSLHPASDLLVLRQMIARREAYAEDVFDSGLVRFPDAGRVSTFPGKNRVPGHAQRSCEAGVTREEAAELLELLKDGMSPLTPADGITDLHWRGNSHMIDILAYSTVSCPVYRRGRSEHGLELEARCIRPFDSRGDIVEAVPAGDLVEVCEVTRPEQMIAVCPE